MNKERGGAGGGLFVCSCPAPEIMPQLDERREKGGESLAKRCWGAGVPGAFTSPNFEKVMHFFTLPPMRKVQTFHWPSEQYLSVFICCSHVTVKNSPHSIVPVEIRLQSPRLGVTSTARSKLQRYSFGDPQGHVSY